MIRNTILAGLTMVIIANVAGVVFAEQEMRLQAGFTWLVALGSLLLSSVLLATVAYQAGRDLAAVGFLVLALYAVVHSVAVGVWSSDMMDVYLAIYPARMMVMAIGLFLIGTSGWFASWIRGVGMLTAGLGLFLGSLVLYGAELGGETPGVADLLNMLGFALFLLTVIGWLNEVRTSAAIDVTSHQNISPD